MVAPSPLVLWFLGFSYPYVNYDGDDIASIRDDDKKQYTRCRSICYHDPKNVSICIE